MTATLITTDPCALVDPDPLTIPTHPVPTPSPLRRESESDVDPRTISTHPVPTLPPMRQSEIYADVENDEPALSSYPRCSDGNGTLSFLFFSDDDLELARAKAICRTCGLQEACLAGAVEREEPYGVWGGRLVLDGVPVDFKRKRGRPRKNPEPLLVVDEAPIPPHLVA